MSYLTISDLNPNDLSSDKHLSVAIAVTFVVSAFHVCDEPVLRKKIFMLLEWKRYSVDELRANSDLIWKFIDFNSVPGSSLTKATYIPQSIICAFKSVLADSFSAIYANYAVNNSCYALGLYDFEVKYIHGALINLLPVILDYKINVSKQAFRDSEKAFEFLGEDDKEKFLFNLDILQ